ncbi:MAG: hypothetical protein EOP81_05105 [Variovorax sp.]|nr:MAG: hypothetical protein EOP81_05105 [Variovorax sp.]
MLRTALMPLLAAVVLGLAGCASEPTRIAPGTPAAETLQRLGPPTGRYALPGGGERLQYSRAPAGSEVTNIDVDATGRVVSVVQVLQEIRFHQDIQVGNWRQADVLRTYGRPFEITRVSSFNGLIWTWRYKSINAPRLLHIYIDPAGVVQRYHVADDLTFERLRW